MPGHSILTWMPGFLFYHRVTIGEEFMAISKLKAITSTLDKAIAYITDPEKTDGGCLVDTFGCSLGTADLEMLATAKKGRGNGERIAYHLIQSFSPEDDITPEKALEIGREFAGKVTGGRYEFVLATHMDKGHIHNHIIFNASNFIDYKKYHHSVKDTYRIRNINDEICRQNHLSVIENFSGNRGKSWYSCQQPGEKNRQPDKKQRLKNVMDQAIQKAESYEEFLTIMELEGYEYRDKGSSLSFKYTAGGDKNSIRVNEKNFNEYYTKEMIRKRILDKEFDRHIAARAEIAAETVKEEKTNKPAAKKKTAHQEKRINLMIDISKNLKAKQSQAYERALVSANIDTMARTLNYLIQHQIQTPEEFQAYASGIQTEYEWLKKDIRSQEEAMLELSEKIKFTQGYQKGKALFRAALKAADKKQFMKEHEEEIILYKAAEMYFAKQGIDPASLKLQELFEEYRERKQEKLSMQNALKPLRQSLKELKVVEQNIEEALGIKMTEEDGQEEKKNDRRKDHPVR